MRRPSRLAAAVTSPRPGRCAGRLAAADRRGKDRAGPVGANDPPPAPPSRWAPNRFPPPRTIPISAEDHRHRRTPHGIFRKGKTSTGKFSKSFPGPSSVMRSEEHTSELQSHVNLVCRLLLEKKKKNT